MAGLKHPVTPDGRYFVVRGKLWRMANPNLSAEVRSALVSELMAARSAVRSAKLTGDYAAETAAHLAVDVVKRKLGERGPAWWTDGAPDLNRLRVRDTQYAKWFSSLKTAARRTKRGQFLDKAAINPPVEDFAASKAMDTHLCSCHGSSPFVANQLRCNPAVPPMAGIRAAICVQHSGSGRQDAGDLRNVERSPALT
jgi:hypothetical protein